MTATTVFWNHRASTIRRVRSRAPPLRTVSSSHAPATLAGAPFAARGWIRFAREPGPIRPLRLRRRTGRGRTAVPDHQDSG
ncbi:hypothetical protein GCM10027294_13890 [Marinactinospora endophytica]